MDRNAILWGGLAGVAAGAMAWLVLRPVVDYQLKGMIRDQLRTQLPQQLNAELDAKLRQYGFTPETGQQIARIINATARTGVI